MKVGRKDFFWWGATLGRDAKMWWGEAVRQDRVGRNLSGPRPVSAPDSLPYFVDNKVYRHNYAAAGIIKIVR